MDYQLNIYPSSEKELQNFKANNSSKQIKIMMENKLQTLYKSVFSAAVKKYNERAISGKLIDNYYQSILTSNVPEVYCLSLIIRYELLNKQEITAIQKAFMDFKREFEKAKCFKVVSVYALSYDEFKELQIFFFPVSDGYATGLSVRNDLIDVTKKLCYVKENINIIKAMPLLVKYVDQLFAPINDGQFISQEELERQAKNVTVQNPMVLHAIAVETLKTQMNNLQKINAENKRLESVIEAEKARIQHDIVWSKETEVKIHEAEKARIEEEQRLAEEERRAEEARRVAEAQKREEDRLREEERRVEAERLAAQARRNIELRKQMTQQEKELQNKRLERKNLDQDAFALLIEQHLTWQETYQINEEVDYDKIPEDAMKDPRRLNLISANIHDVRFDRPVQLIGIALNDCEFSDCNINVELISSSIANSVIMNSEINDTSIAKCVVNNVNMDRLSVENVKIEGSTMMKCNFKHMSIAEMFSAPSTSFIRCDFSDAELKSCDMKKNAFVNSTFDNTRFVACDMRDSVFQVCEVDTMKKEGSLFRGAKFNKE